MKKVLFFLTFIVIFLPIRGPEFFSDLINDYFFPPIFLRLMAMKQHKLVFAFMFLVFAIVACSKKIATSKDVVPAKVSEAIPREPQGVTIFDLNDANLPAAGKVVYETKCTRCHAMKPIALYTEPRWDAILKIMVPKANLTEQEAGQVTAYVKANAKK
ncbi:MAG TPA: cytochrome c [Chitinophagaceae bacterium]|nr:cytochrome c [Chitinophagaceae bacterium]